METDITKVKEKVAESILLRLGDTVVDVELSDAQLIKCIDLALAKLRQRSDAYVEESLIMLNLVQNQSTYILPDEIIEVEKLYRRGFGRGIYSGNNINPFEYAWANVYMLGALGAGKSGGLVTYESNNQYLKQAGRMFCCDMDFNFSSSSHTLRLYENPRADEEIILIHGYVDRPEYLLLQDRYAGLWLENWAYAEAKEMLGGIRTMFSALPGGNRDAQMNGTDLKNEAKALKEELEKELSNYIPGGQVPFSFMVG